MKSVIASLSIFLVLILVSCNSSNPSKSQTETYQAPGTSQPTENKEQSSAFQPKPMPQETELPAGTVFLVRLDQALSTSRNRAGDTFTASLDAPVNVGGKELLPIGTRFTGHVTTADSSGRLKGRGVLGITMDSFDLNGTAYPVTTSLDTRTTEAHKKRNIEMIGGGTGLGALIGGLAGGGKGALIGAGAGAAAGTGAAAATGKKNVEISAETVFRFKLKTPVKVKA